MTWMGVHKLNISAVDSYLAGHRLRFWEYLAGYPVFDRLFYSL